MDDIGGTFEEKVRIWLRNLKIDVVDLNIYIQSLTHRSYANEKKIMSRGNEQLEFLGDSVLSFIITSYLYHNYKSLPEGKMAKIRAFLVSRRTLFEIAKEIKIDRYILLSKNEESCMGRRKVSILADSVEALIGAIYIDKGIDFTFDWVIKLYKDRIIENVNAPEITDYKTYLQEAIQADYSRLVRYELVKSEGPDHDKSFYSVAMIDDKVVGKGKGKSKKDSEQNAAKNTLKKLYNLNL
ncbi:MAG: ribonuclease III [Candidatus Humimicrobiaceae bacterium]|jgi:ribonuclease-3|nr:ribonuclease III [Actinomycetota bacterium]MDD5600561.1 ribonuclease III [Actinomycetota bacterium]MDY0027676.1 ribonuclease III [Candidatus Humimicrobiaceae bacterium]